METLGYIGAIVMGLSLGLIGGGGSILTVPILVYLFSVDAVLATAYSLFIVGLTSLIGSFSHMRLGNIHWRTAIVFGIPSILAVYATRAFLVPALPDPLFTLGGTEISKSLGILVLFALLMLAASFSMIRKGKPKAAPDPSKEQRFNYPLILGEGIVVGTITGLVGAGGGFLIIPALVLLAGLPMKQAVGTSLIIIAAKSLIGFTGDLKGHEVIDWNFLLVFSVIAVGGIIAGSILSKRIPNEKLKPAFGWFVLVMGIYIIGRELSNLA
ncbi:MAG TPA: sulfite exporter TauE/SafE family protein [Flavobacteriales bacterium]|nr:sulfite exporter TauE/SafE family protein [Flavobacteriales bacterium]MCB0814560.1 sulfite exporter TauE/SafE family protein [Flavobacteriales bacterium]MCB0816216.1 sulfite exporter TauE/SafE family protein [Flavobacteriales bacterium]HOP44231.1 sulfite exporter TauE/SafE family protein [Flavobacteriales bacterium]HPJ52588.1 sulfite exporter TauE/SafE family protein [Flavobacteriales bacterium]